MTDRMLKGWQLERHTFPKHRHEHITEDTWWRHWKPVRSLFVLVPPTLTMQLYNLNCFTFVHHLFLSHLRFSSFCSISHVLFTALTQAAVPKDALLVRRKSRKWYRSNIRAPSGEQRSGKWSSIGTVDLPENKPPHMNAMLPQLPLLRCALQFKWITIPSQR